MFQRQVSEVRHYVANMELQTAAALGSANASTTASASASSQQISPTAITRPKIRRLPPPSMMPRTRCAPSVTTRSGLPLRTTPIFNKGSAGCIVWIHMQASICTEWEQNSMVISPGSSSAAGTSGSLSSASSTTTATSALKSSSQQSSDSMPGASSSSEINAVGPESLLLRQVKTEGGNQKKPKTIHRCILQRSQKSSTSTSAIRTSSALGGTRGAPSGGTNSTLNCHVCDSSYTKYDAYYNHLMDSTCARKKEAKELKTLILKTNHPHQATASRGLASTREQQGATMAVSPHQQVILKQQQNQQSHHRPPAIRIRNPLELVDLSGPTFQQQQEKPRVMPGEIAEVNGISCQPAFARKRALSAEGQTVSMGGAVPLNLSKDNTSSENKLWKPPMPALIPSSTSSSSVPPVSIMARPTSWLKEGSLDPILGATGSAVSFRSCDGLSQLNNNSSSDVSPTSSSGSAPGGTNFQGSLSHHRGSSDYDHNATFPLAPGTKRQLTTSSGNSLASDTLSVLTSSLGSVIMTNKRRKMMREESEASAVAANSDTGQRHTHFLTEVENRDLVVPGAVGTEGISLVDHASDQTRMASLKEQIVRLIGASLGESGLFRWGFPDVDVLEILDSILQSANVKPFTVADIDKSLVNTMYPKDPLKSKFVAYRRKIYASKVNVKLLLLLCFKSDDWTEQDWDKKPIDAVLAEINSSTDPKSEASR